jgi:hypothetical protein
VATSLQCRFEISACTIRRVVSIVAALAFASPLTAQGVRTAEEYSLKAALVYKFPPFVEWPAAALDGRDAVQLCVAPPNPFGATLEQLVAEETLHGRRVVVRPAPSPAAIADCHVLFVSRAAEAAATPLLERAARAPVLTVGETPAFLARGGVIALDVVNQKVQFDVNMESAGRAGLKLSSQLLRLARAVKGPA